MASKKAANRSWVNKTRKCTNGRCGQEKSLFFFLGEKSTEDPIMKWCYPCRLTHPLYRKINETTEKESAAAEAKDIILNWAAIKIEHFHNFVSTYCVVDERQTLIALVEATTTRRLAEIYPKSAEAPRAVKTKGQSAASSSNTRSKLVTRPFAQVAQDNRREVSPTSSTSSSAPLRLTKKAMARRLQQRDEAKPYSPSTRVRKSNAPKTSINDVEPSIGAVGNATNLSNATKDELKLKIEYNKHHIAELETGRNAKRVKYDNAIDLRDRFVEGTQEALEKVQKIEVLYKEMKEKHAELVKERDAAVAAVMEIENSDELQAAQEEKQALRRAYETIVQAEMEELFGSG